MTSRAITLSKIITVCLIIMLLPAVSSAQHLETQPPEHWLPLIEKSRPDSNRINLLLNLGSYYLFKDGAYKQDMDNAQHYFNEALQLSNTLNLFELKNETLKLIGNCYLESEQLQLGKACFKQVTDYYSKTGNKKEEALAWVRLGNAIPQLNAALISEKINSYRHGQTLFDELKGKLAASPSILTAIELMYVDVGWNIYDQYFNLAQCQLELGESIHKAISSDKLHEIYYLFARLNKKKGDLQKELFYNMEAIKSAEFSGDSADSRLYYYRLGQTYQDLGMYDESIGIFKKLVPLIKNREFIWNSYVIICAINELLILQNKPQEALAFLQQNIKESPPVDKADNQWVSAAFGSCYEALNDNVKAERYYLEMIRLTDNDVKDKIDVTGAYKKISTFYIRRKQYAKADFYLQYIKKIPKDASLKSKSAIYLLRFIVDSAQGRYLSAINNLEEYKALTDSMFNITKSKQIEELKISYATDQMNKDIRIKSKNIELLNKESIIQKINAARAMNLMLGGGLLLLLILGIMYNRYRSKQKSNLQLMEKQNEITAKNHSLELLLTENEWLLREVHHRVKNNLQIVLSLLNSQSLYLKDEAALNAIMESQHRIQAMSLIHQKLYKTNNTSSINLQEYVTDLVEYLQDSFKTRKAIYFSLVIEPISLDISRAVPIGLILNEVITNSLKYAFPYTKNDKVTIQLSNVSCDNIVLKIVDNGRGLPRNFDFDTNKSFGIKLIRGLAQELKGNFTINSDNGTTCTITFDNTPLEKHSFPLKNHF